MENKPSKSKFKMEINKTLPSSGDVGGSIFKRQRIMIRPVINLPQHDETAKPLSDMKEEYNPFQPTAIENETVEKNDEVYDPFQPTLSDNEESLVNVSEKEAPLDHNSFKTTGHLKPVEKEPAAIDPVYDFDIDQMLDSQYNAAVETKKTGKQSHNIKNKLKLLTEKQSSKSDFDIFAEEELEKAHAAASSTSISKSVKLLKEDGEFESKINQRSQKIKSAFSAEHDPFKPSIKEIIKNDSTSTTEIPLPFGDNNVASPEIMNTSNQTDADALSSEGYQLQAEEKNQHEAHNFDTNTSEEDEQDKASSQVSVGFADEQTMQLMSEGQLPSLHQSESSLRDNERVSGNNEDPLSPDRRSPSLDLPKHSKFSKQAQDKKKRISESPDVRKSPQSLNSPAKDVTEEQPTGKDRKDSKSSHKEDNDFSPSRSTKKDESKDISKSESRKKSKSPKRRNSRSPHGRSSKNSPKKQKKKRSRSRSKSAKRRRSRSTSKRRRRSRSTSKRRRRSRSTSKRRRKSRSTSNQRRRSRSTSSRRRRSRSKSGKRDYSKSSRKDAKKHSTDDRGYSRKRRSTSKSPRKSRKQRKKSRSRSKSQSSVSPSRYSRSKSPRKLKKQKRSRSKSTQRRSHSPAKPTKKAERKRSRSQSRTDKIDSAPHKEKREKSSKKHLKADNEKEEKAQTSDAIVEQPSVKVKDNVANYNNPLNLFYDSDNTESEDEESTKKKKKKKKKKAEKDQTTVEDAGDGTKKKKRNKRTESVSSDSEAKSPTKSRKEDGKTQLEPTEYDYDRKAKKKKKRRHSSERCSSNNDELDSAKHSKASKKKKQRRKTPEFEVEEEESQKLDADRKSASQGKKSKKKKRKSSSQNYAYEEKDLLEKKTHEENISNSQLSPESDKKTESTSKSERKDLSALIETENLIRQKDDGTTSTEDTVTNSKLHGVHATSNLNVQTSISSRGVDEHSDKPYDPEEVLTGARGLGDLDDASTNKALRSPSLSPPFLSPASSPTDDQMNSQNSSMVVSSQELTETPSYAETFLEQSRKRWEKSLRNKSPHVSSAHTPDDASAVEGGKVKSKPAKQVDPHELSSLSDISTDVNDKPKVSDHETIGDTSFSVEDIFAQSPPKSKDDQAQMITGQEQLPVPPSETKVDASDGLEAEADSQVPSTESDFRDTDNRTADEKQPVSEREKRKSPETKADDGTTTSRRDKMKETSKTAAEKASSPPSRKKSPSRSSRRHSDRKKSERRKRSRSRSTERKSKHRKSPSRSPSRKHSYRSQRNSSRDRRRYSDKGRSPDRRRYSRERSSRSSQQVRTASASNQGDAKSPKIELLNKFLEQSAEFISQNARAPVKVAPEQVPIITSPQPIATISGIASGMFTDRLQSSETQLLSTDLSDHHEMASNSFPSLVNESRPALIQIPTIDSHTIEVDNANDPVADDAVAQQPTDTKKSEIYSPSNPMSPISPEKKSESPFAPPPPPPPPPPAVPPLKVTSSTEVSSTTSTSAASLFSKLFGFKKDSDDARKLEATLKQDSAPDKEAENVLNPTQILNIAGLNPQQQSAAKDAIMSIAELSKQLQLGQILSNVEKSKGTVVVQPDHRESDGLSPVNIDSIESSAVDMYNRDKQKALQKKKEFQDRVVTAAKTAIKPHYERREVNKEQYKDIMKRAVNKICQTDKNMEVNEVKIRRLIRRYVECYQQKNEKKKEKMRMTLDQKLKKHMKVKVEDDMDFIESPPSPEDSPLDAPYSPIDEDEVNESDEPVSVPSLLKKEPRKIVTLPDLPLPPPPPPPRPKYMM